MIPVEIGSEEWIEMRRRYITATDAAAIMGMSPYETAIQRYEAKLSGAQKVRTPAMQRGIDLEPMARLIFEEQTGHMVMPAWRVHPEFEWMAATFDGINDQGVVVEIKCPGEADHMVAVTRKIPDKYFCQCQHQMAVAGVDEMYYFSYKPDHPISWAMVNVQADYEFRIKMMQAEKEFFDCLQSGTPPSLSAKDVVLRENRAWLLREEELFNLRANKKMIEAEEKRIKDELIAMCEGQASKGYRLKLAPTEVKGHIDYDCIPLLKEIDLEPYRKPKTTQWRIYEL